MNIKLIFTLLRISDKNLPLFALRNIEQLLSYLRSKGFVSIRETLDKSQKNQGIKKKMTQFVGIEKERLNENFLTFISKVVRKIEISLPIKNSTTDRQNKMVYFLLQPQTSYLEDSTKKNFITTLDVNNSRAYLIKYMKIMMIEMESKFELSKSNKYMYSLTKNKVITVHKFIAWGVGVIINLMFLIDYKLPKLESDDLDKGTRQLQGNKMTSAMQLLSLALACYCGILFLAWSIYKGPIEAAINFEIYSLTSGVKVKNLDLNQKISIIFRQIYIKYKPLFNFSIHLIASILALLGNVWFHTIHLLLFINISGSALIMLKAALKRLALLRNGLILISFIVFSFTVILNNNFNDKFNEDSYGKYDLCQDLQSCFWSTLNLGLRLGGGIGEGMDFYSYPQQNKFFSKTLFDLLFFIMVKLVILNMVFGIIIDTFGGLRDRILKRKEILDTSCLICLNTKLKSQGTIPDFKKHKEDDHDLWLYVYYVKYLKDKKRRDMTHDEQNVWNNYRLGGTRWMPLGDTLFKI
jgi:Ion transport protein